MLELIVSNCEKHAVYRNTFTATVGIDPEGRSIELSWTRQKMETAIFFTVSN